MSLERVLILVCAAYRSGNSRRIRRLSLVVASATIVFAGALLLSMTAQGSHIHTVGCTYHGLGNGAYYDSFYPNNWHLHPFTDTQQCSSNPYTEKWAYLYYRLNYQWHLSSPAYCRLCNHAHNTKYYEGVAKCHYSSWHKGSQISWHGHYNENPPYCSG